MNFMKFLIVTCLKEYQSAVAGIFKQAGIAVYSATDLIGFKDGVSQNMLANWFASGDEQFDSMMLFSFTSTEIANHAIELIKTHNQQLPSNFPLRAFLVPVENAV
jgi:hypothetical protein